MAFLKMNQLILISIVLLSSICAFALDGVYSVPIDSIAAKNPVTGVELIGAGSQTQLKYYLPEDLVGPGSLAVRLALDSVTQGSQGPSLIFKKGQTFAVCDGKAAGLTCTIRYQSMNFDSQKRDQFLMQKYASDPTLLSEKLHVAAAFGSDPVGILQIFCAQSSCGF
jgi:hypothetical protein